MDDAGAARDLPPPDSATLDEAVAFLVDCGFASSELDPPSSEEPPCKFALGRAQEGIDVESSSGTTNSIRKDEFLHDIRLVSSGKKRLIDKPPSVKLKPRRRRTAKDEIEKLRHQVADLTITRDGLRRQVQLRPGKTEGREQNTALWEQVANLQRNQRELSEAKNGQLRKLLQTNRRKTRYL